MLEIYRLSFLKPLTLLVAVAISNSQQVGDKFLFIISREQNASLIKCSNDCAGRSSAHFPFAILFVIFACLKMWVSLALVDH